MINELYKSLRTIKEEDIFKPMDRGDIKEPSVKEMAKYIVKCDLKYSPQIAFEKMFYGCKGYFDGEMSAEDEQDIRDQYYDLLELYGPDVSVQGLYQ